MHNMFEQLVVYTILSMFLPRHIHILVVDTNIILRYYYNSITIESYYYRHYALLSTVNTVAIDIIAV